MVENVQHLSGLVMNRWGSKDLSVAGRGLEICSQVLTPGDTASFEKVFRGKETAGSDGVV